jgi:hypothetical protein
MRVNSTARRARRHRRRVDTNDQLSSALTEVLAQRPQQAGRNLRLGLPDDPSMSLRHEKYLSSCLPTDFTFRAILAPGIASTLTAAYRS